MWPQTRARVLTMDFEEGVCATDVKSLKEMNLPLDRVAQLISSVFCEQVNRRLHVFLYMNTHTCIHSKKHAPIVLISQK